MADNVSAADDEALLARFEKNPKFKKNSKEWTPEQRAAFCLIARSIHATGLDAYHTNTPDTRFGRKPNKDKVASGVIARLRSNDDRELIINRKAPPEFGLKKSYALSPESSTVFADDIEKASDKIRDWMSKNSNGPGKWPDDYGDGAFEEDASEPSLKNDFTMDDVAPTNLILYGPPGTGKTYQTAREAVALCDGTAPEVRSEMMMRYNELVGQKRIGFVTFHQNYGYEDFVEGLRPTTDPSGDGDADGTVSAGFKLEPKSGIFRVMCERSERSFAKPDSDATVYDTVQVFKMSLGRSGIEDEIFEEARRGNYIALGWGGEEDWSLSKYDGEAGYREIYDRWNEIEPGSAGNSGNISQVWRFRSSMRIGDLVLVPYGNTAIRAIGRITGNYLYVPDDRFAYRHHRPVEWLKHFETPVPVSEVYNKSFSMASCYKLADQELKRDGLARLLGDSTSESVDNKSDKLPHVLIIDEINRANVSKVFGELITLIEPDKRQGMDNALSVTLPYSGEQFSVPANLHIIGTMNTADRSIALLDTALRRRFNFRELAPDPKLLKPVDGIDLAKVLTTINERIEYLIDREHRIGHAFFIGCKTEQDVYAAMRDKVIPLLQEYFFEDWSRIRDVLGVGFIGSADLKSPRSDGEVRKSWFVHSPFKDDAFRLLIGKSEGVAAATDEQANESTQ